MYCLGTAGLLFVAFALYQLFSGLRDLRLAARLREGEAIPIGSLKPGGVRIVVGIAQAAEGVRSPLHGTELAWLRARLAQAPEEVGSSRQEAPRLLVDHESPPLSLTDDTGTAHVSPRRAHDALPRAEMLELDDGLPEALEPALRELGLEGTPPAAGELWYQEHRFEPGQRLYVVGKVTRAMEQPEGGAYRSSSASPARIEDAVVSPDTPAGLARPYHARGLFLVLGGLILGGLGASMLAMMARQLLFGPP